MVDDVFYCNLASLEEVKVLQKDPPNTNHFSCFPLFVDASTGYTSHILYIIYKTRKEPSNK